MLLNNIYCLYIFSKRVARFAICAAHSLNRYTSLLLTYFRTQWQQLNYYMLRAVLYNMPGGNCFEIEINVYRFIDYY